MTVKLVEGDLGEILREINMEFAEGRLDIDTRDAIIVQILSELPEIG